MLVPGILSPCHQPCAMAGCTLDLTYVRQRDFKRTLEGPSLPAPRMWRTDCPRKWTSPRCYCSYAMLMRSSPSRHVLYVYTRFQCRSRVSNPFRSVALASRFPTPIGFEVKWDGFRSLVRI